MAGGGTTLKTLSVLAALVAGAVFVVAVPANAQVTSHPTICRNWGNLAMGVYARYQTKYKTVFALLASQARDEEADARSKGWSEENIKHLLMIVSNAQSGQWNDVNKFGEDEFNGCIAQWKASSTPEERAAEDKAVARHNAEVTAANDRNVAHVARTLTCQQYQRVAIDIITLHHTGASYQRAAEVAASKAYGPGGQVLRYSEENADYFMMLAAAVYFARDKYGTSDQTFMARAFKDCMRGEFLNASK